LQRKKRKGKLKKYKHIAWQIKLIKLKDLSIKDRASCSCKLIIFFIRKNGTVSDFLLFSLDFFNDILIHIYSGRSDGDSINEMEIWVTSKLTENPEEGLFVLVIWFCGDIVVLKRSLSVEGDLSCLDFSILGIDFVTNKDDRDIFTDSSQILMPLRNVLVSDSSSDIEHHNSSMSTNTDGETKTNY